MLECWKFLPGDRPTFRHCLEVLELLKTTTSSSIEITVATPNPRNSDGKDGSSFPLHLQSNVECPL